MDLHSFIDLCNSRRSIRYFDDKKTLTLDDIEPILQAAHLAPSVENIQPWHFHVVINKDLRSKLMETSCYGNFIAGASAFIVVTCDKAATPTTKDTLWNPRELEYSCVAAMEHVVLAATAAGFGSSWVSLHHGPARDVLELPAHHIVVGGVMIGVIKASEKTPGSHHIRKAIGEMYTVYN